MKILRAINMIISATTAFPKAYAELETEGDFQGLPRGVEMSNGLIWFLIIMFALRICQNLFIYFFGLFTILYFIRKKMKVLHD
jgi:hypothetical protein